MGYYTSDHLNEILSSGNIHEHEEQRVRQRNARKCQVISVDGETKTAEFKGSGKNPYITTIGSCTCQDFGMRKLPCKHMYRLMHELGEFDLDEVPAGRESEITSPRGVFSSDILKGLSDGAKEELYHLVRMWIVHACPNDWLYERENPKAIELVKAGLLEEFDAPNRILTALSMAELREVLKTKGLKARSKADAIAQILEIAPEVLAAEKAKYWPLRFKEEHRPIRGQLRTYLKTIFPDPELPDEYDPEVFQEGLSSKVTAVN